MKSFTSHSIAETQKIAADWLTDISTKYADLDEALVVGLSGHLGAGKTAFVKAVAKELGIMEVVTSPTFVIMKIYEISGMSDIPRDVRHPGWKHLVHIDAYRLERAEELGAINFESIVSDPNNLVMIEWPENVGLTEFKVGAGLKFEIRDGLHNVSTA